MHLTKSDFKACFDCLTRLYYRKRRYPTASEENEYLRFLADGGFMVEYIAKERFPGGVDLVEERDAAAATVRTAELLREPGVTIFEAGATHGRYHARIDVLRKTGDVLELIEVKSSAIDDDEDDAASPFLNKKGTGVLSRWKPYIMDVAFQAHVLRLAYPHFTVRPMLCVVNKAHVATDNETLARFTLRKDAADARARPEVRYHGDRAGLAASSLLVLRDVEAETALLMPEVTARAAQLAALFDGDAVTRVQEPIADRYADCRLCDFRVEREPSGFAECWGALAAVTPHILDLHRVSGLGDPDPVAELLRSNRASLLDLRQDQLGNGNSYALRRRLQWDSMRANGAEHLPAGLVAELAAHEAAPGWPLRFIDFEACDLSLPHHAGLRPYERVAFQWSCHTLGSDNRLSHHEWLNDERRFPNFAFARSLRERLGDEGTVYVWSAYEQVTLRKIMEQLLAAIARDPRGSAELAGVGDPAALGDLARWIERLLGPADARGSRSSPRIRDLHRLAGAHYFHPRMAGRTSIKVVLPAVWDADERLRDHPAFRRYVKRDDRGCLLDPYKSLESLPFGDDEGEDNAIREGTGAIRVYQDLLFAERATDDDRDIRRRLLLQYCRLDTAAMVMIWARWRGRYDFSEAG